MSADEGRMRRDDPPAGPPRRPAGTTPVAAKGPWQGLRGGYRVRTSRAWRTNSAVLTDGRHAVLLDPGVTPSEIADLMAAVPAGAEVLTVFTHHHWDHVLSRPWLPAGARTLAHETFAAELAHDLAHARSEAERHAAEWGEPLPQQHQPFVPDVTVRDGESVKHGPFTLQFRHVPGHSSDSIAVLVPEASALFVGDLLSDVEPPSLEEPPAVYRDSLARLEPWLAKGADVLVPGHGSIARGSRVMLQRMRADLAYLDTLESGVTAAVQAGRDADATVAELESLKYPGADGKPYSTADWHHANVRLVWGVIAGR